jgi:MFS family permease
MCMGFVQSFGALTAMRFLLGILEAGLFPGIIYLTSMYYRRFEYQKRMTAIWSAVLLSSSISGVSVFLLT